MNAIKKKFGTIGFEVKCFWKEKKGWCKSKYILIELTSFHVNGPKYKSVELVIEEKYDYEMKKNQVGKLISNFFYQVTKFYLWSSYLFQILLSLFLVYFHGSLLHFW
jgi:hypothetical protein